jgi:hypothetical protein
MLHVCVQTFDVTENLKIFLKLNMALLKKHKSIASLSWAASPFNLHTTTRSPTVCLVLGSVVGTALTRVLGTAPTIPLFGCESEFAPLSVWSEDSDGPTVLW